MVHDKRDQKLDSSTYMSSYCSLLGLTEALLGVVDLIFYALREALTLWGSLPTEYYPSGLYKLYFT